jgi:hypothetical protein
MQESTDLTEQTKHKRYVELLAEELNEPVENVESIYSDVLIHLKEKAEIVDYVPVFAWRRTRALLARR